MTARKTLANAIRVLAMDAVQKADSGHPGMPMGMADIAEVLWRDYLKHNPKNPNWSNRDRFVLSNGHGCLLQYALLHLTGYDLSIEDMMQFRQFHSKTPGHPEYGMTPGVETTTGPLGQGLAMGVGMALAEKRLAAEFNTESHTIVDHYTYVFVGDGCLMEGVSHEACSLAGTWALNKLIVFYDDNGISIDGPVSGWFTDDTPKRFEAYHWQVLPNVDGHDSAAVAKAIAMAHAEQHRPTLICCKTKIGYGAPNLAGSEKTHGSPLGDAEVAAAKAALGWTHPAFEIPADIYTTWSAVKKGNQLESEWHVVFDTYQKKYPEKAAEFLRRSKNSLPNDFVNNTKAFIERLQADKKPLATRKSSQQCIEEFSEQLPELIGGSADLSGSNGTLGKNAHMFSIKNVLGNYIYYGVREFAMSAIMNGLALHKGFIPFGGTFLTFTDYARNAVRLSALMHQKVVFVYSHDSIGLGEDGPTHQPVEHIALLRMTPGLMVWRPCDTTETAIAWQQALMHEGPSALLLTRQNVSQFERHSQQLQDSERGGYVLYEPKSSLNAIIIATGSEVQLAMHAAKALESENQIGVRVVSMPCCERFKAQSAEYRESVLPRAIRARLAIEAGVSDYWYQFVGDQGKIIGVDTFGASAPEAVLWEKYGFTVENVKKQLQSLLSNAN